MFTYGRAASDMQRLVLLLPAVAAATQTYDIQYEDASIDGYQCSEDHKARIYYPNASGTYPIVAFSHGFDNPGALAYNCYGEMNMALAKAGYVVVVTETSNYPLECPNIYKDALRTIDWTKASDIASKIDYSKAGLMGHSMGGGSSYHAASMADVVKEYSIGAVVGLHPQILPFNHANPLVPIFFGTGSNDTVIPPSWVKSAYEAASGVPKVFTEIEGAGHKEPMCDCPYQGGTWHTPGLQRHTPYVIAMFDCHLKGDKSQCDKVYSSKSSSLCSGPVKMTECVHENEPSQQLTV